MAGLVEPLGGAHGGAGGEAEAAVGFNLESGGGEGDGALFGGFGFVDSVDGEVGAV